MDIAHSLSTLAMLERRFDGPIPLALRQAVTDGTSHAASAVARSVLFDRLARHATAALARSRAAACPVQEARLARDLRLYRQAGIAWRDLARALSRS